MPPQLLKLALPFSWSLIHAICATVDLFGVVDTVNFEFSSRLISLALFNELSTPAFLFLSLRWAKRQIFGICTRASTYFCFTVDVYIDEITIKQENRVYFSMFYVNIRFLDKLCNSWQFTYIYAQVMNGIDYVQQVLNNDVKQYNTILSIIFNMGHL